MDLDEISTNPKIFILLHYPFCRTVYEFPFSKYIRFWSWSNDTNVKRTVFHINRMFIVLRLIFHFLFLQDFSCAFNMNRLYSCCKIYFHFHYIDMRCECESMLVYTIFSYTVPPTDKCEIPIHIFRFT